MNILEKINQHSNRQNYQNSMVQTSNNILTLIPQIDFLIGGLPDRGFIQILDTNTSMGKTSLGLYLANSLSSQNKNILYIDIDFEINSSILKNRGVKNDFCFFNSGNAQEIIQIIGSFEESLDVVIFDSLPSLMTNDSDTEAFKNLRIFLDNLPKDKLYIILNQKRNKFRKSFLSGYSDITLLDYCYLNIHLSNSFLINKDFKPIGYKINTQVITYGSCNLYMFFDRGFDFNFNLLKFSVEKQWIERRGSHFYYDDYHIGNSYECQIPQEIIDELYNKIIDLT